MVIGRGVWANRLMNMDSRRERVWRGEKLVLRDWKGWAGKESFLKAEDPRSLGRNMVVKVLSV